MRQSSFVRPAALALAVLIASGLTAARASAQTGKVTGVVSDSATGNPIEGVQVVLLGSGYGAVTQTNGRYFILGVPPGNYTVSARRIGYGTRQTSVQVAIDVTREVNFRMSSAATTLGVVTVQASRAPLVELTSTGSGTQITAAEVEALPVRSVADVLSLQAGFSEIPTSSTDLNSFTQSRRSGIPPILIRGGRAGETGVLIDDIPVTNFLFGGQTLDISQTAVETIQTLKGGLEPRYGNALSGIVNIATKEGGTTLNGSLNYETSRIGGAMGSTPDALRKYDFIEGFISGPVPATNSKLRFILSGRTKTSAQTVEQFDNEIFDPFLRDTVKRAPYAQDLIPGWRASGYNNERDLFGKLTLHLTEQAKLSLGVIDYNLQSLTIPFDWELTGFNESAACIAAYQPIYGKSMNVTDVCNTLYSADRVSSSGRPLGEARNQYITPAPVDQQRDLYTLRYEQTIGRLNYKVVGGILDQSRITCATYFSGICLGDRIADTNFNGRFVDAGVTSQDITPTEGTDRIAGSDNMRTRLLRGDMELQATDHHTLGAGLFYQGHNIQFHEVNDVGLNNIVLQPSDYAAKPWDASAYLQDRIEYDFLTVKLGARFDYGRARGIFFNDPLDPTNGTTLSTVCANPTKFGLDPRAADFTDPVTGAHFTGSTACTQANNQFKIAGPKGDSVLVSASDLARDVAFKDDMGEAPTRKSFSPRLGVQFPVTSSSSAFFNFGVYYQNPLYNNVYQGTGIGTPAEGTRAAAQLLNGLYIGNPRLRAEQTTSYELGYSSEFLQNYSVQIVAFSKDQSGLTGIRNGGYLNGTLTRVYDLGATYSGTSTPSYTVLVNQDYQTVRGFEIEARRRLSDFYSWRLNYGYSQATNNAAPPDLEQQQVQGEGDAPARQEIRSDVDQNHTLNASLTFNAKNQTPNVRFGSLLRNFSLSGTLRAASGLPYTPALTFTGNSQDRLERNSGTAPPTMRIDLQAEKRVNISNLEYGIFARVENVLDRKNCIQVYATTGNCEGGASPQARLAAGNFTGESEGSTFFDRPQYVGTRRTINAGVRVNF